MSDRPLQLHLPTGDEVQWIDLSQLCIHHCVGCFGCWTKTPGKCVIRDDAVTVYPKIAQSEAVIYVSRIRYGSYDIAMKTVLERAIPVQQAFIRVLDGETHHIQRRVVPKKAVIIAYGADGEEEREIFRRLVSRNARNMNLEQYEVLFTTETQLEQTVQNEVEKWNRL